ncbi:ABC transporter ATP-binding protein [Cytobacillus kochii]|uniref:ABC transporter ATP-binding protein n=1 Tax=Cytobacillus kochii TaxID=859143 RepID=UPI001CD6F216|nr:ABC transporter ATP-binding protein [Cytobacillus kochii]MCA1026660.1 ABC transporter ATP-binding protein [Cytobacillus kochii]
MKQELIKVENLQASFSSQQGTIHAINNVNFSINEGEIVALVGESGSGKSVTALSIMGLNAGNIKYSQNSTIYYRGENLLASKPKTMKKIRGNELSMIFQDPLSSLNPLQKIGRQIAEPLMLHLGYSYQKCIERIIELLTMVGIPSPEQRINHYPHQLSGGMRQRVMIAMALACDPKLLIADEPTTALDVTIQAQILSVLKKLQKEMNISIILITHDLGVVAELADRVLVMYSGKIVEEADVYSLFESPKHPYTKGLLQSVPNLRGDKENHLYTIPGTVPNPLNLPKGCSFYNRCMHASPKCHDKSPTWKYDNKSLTRGYSCWHPLTDREEVKHYV